MNSILHLSTLVREQTGEKGFFIKSQEAPTFQAIVYSVLKKQDFTIIGWVPKQITVLKGKKELTFNYGKKRSCCANDIVNYFSKIYNG